LPAIIAAKLLLEPCLGGRDIIIRCHRPAFGADHDSRRTHVAQEAGHKVAAFQVNEDFPDRTIERREAKAGVARVHAMPEMHHVGKVDRHWAEAITAVVLVVADEHRPVLRPFRLHHPRRHKPELHRQAVAVAHDQPVGVARDREGKDGRHP
jgi:hypothetical protein